MQDDLLALLRGSFSNQTSAQPVFVESEQGDRQTPRSLRLVQDTARHRPTLVWKHRASLAPVARRVGVQAHSDFYGVDSEAIQPHSLLSPPYAGIHKVK